MTFEELASLPPSGESGCFECGVKLTPQNRSRAEQIRPDGKTQGLCQNCYRLDDVVDLRDLGRDRE